MDKIALFFTAGMSLAKWSETGILEREVEPYNQLADEFDTIYFFTYGGEDDYAYTDELADNIEVCPKSINVPDSVYEFLIPFIYRTKLQGCDVLKTNQMKGSVAAMWTKLLYGNALVVRTGYTWSLFNERQSSAWWKDVINEVRVPLTERLAYTLADHGIVTSEHDKEYLMERYDLSDALITVIGNYIKTDTFKPMDKEKRRNTILFIGRLHPQKNLKELIKACARANIKLDIVGEGKQRGELAQFATEQDIDVTFRGRFPNYKIPKVLNEYRYFILPSLYEGNPKTLLEAMSCGLACIATDVEGNSEVVEDGETGLLCGTSAAEISAAIKTLKENTYLRRKLQDNAREYIVDNYSLDTTIEQEENIYNAL